MSTETPECTCPEPMSFGHEPGCPTLTRLVVAPPECQCGNKGLGAHEPACPLGSVQANNEQWSRVADSAVKEWEERIRSLERRNAELTERLSKKQDDINVQFGQLKESRRQVAELTARIAELERDIEKEWIKNGDLRETIEGLRDQLNGANYHLTEARKDGQWQPITEAPEYVDGIELARMLVYSPDFGVTIGQVVKWPDETFSTRIEGQCGNWPITHFKWLPDKPAMLPEPKEGK